MFMGLQILGTTEFMAYIYKFGSLSSWQSLVMIHQVTSEFGGKKGRGR